MPGTEVLMAGFGGQGMLLSGKLLAYAAMQKGYEVSWLPSYGPEMRGGTANVTVCISEKPVGSPYIGRPRELIVMNQPSLERFVPHVRPGGIIVVNASLIPIKVDRPDCRVIYIPANDLAIQAGTVRASNLVMLGAYVALSNIVQPDAIVETIQHEFADKAKFIPANIAAFQAGFDEAKRQEGNQT